MDAVHEYQDFYASHDHMPGSQGTMRVLGVVVFRHGGWQAELRRTEGNTGINPRMLALDLVLTGPPGASTTALENVPVEWSEENADEYEQVQFRVVGTTDEPPPVIKVGHPQ